MSANNKLSEPPLPALLAALADGQADNVTTLPALKQSGGLFSHIVIATANSSRHAQALAQRALRALKNAGHKNKTVEGEKGGDWALIDCGDVVLHIMQEEARDKYRLEALWTFEDADGE